MENQDSGLFALGLLSSNLEELGIETAIEKDVNPNEQKNDLTCMQFLSNGMVNKKNMIYILKWVNKEIMNY